MNAKLAMLLKATGACVCLGGAYHLGQTQPHPPAPYHRVHRTAGHHAPAPARVAAACPPPTAGGLPLHDVDLAGDWHPPLDVYQPPSVPGGQPPTPAPEPWTWVLMVGGAVVVWGVSQLKRPA